MFKWYAALSDFEKKIGMPRSIRVTLGLLFAGIVSYCGSREYVFYKKHELEKEVAELQTSMVLEEKIDRDELADWVIGEHIFFADSTDAGVVYRQLKNYDLYRVR